MLLGKLDEEIEKTGELFSASGTKLVTVGGAVLGLKWVHRLTSDVDIINKSLTSEIQNAIARVGEENGIPKDWMNDAVRLFIPDEQRLEPEYELIFEGDHISVYVPGVRFLLTMKLIGGRLVDVEDCLFLIEQTDITTYEELLDLLELGYPNQTVLTAHTQYIVEKIAEDAGLEPLVKEQ